MRIGLSYHGGDTDYEEYPAALSRRAQALGIEIELLWLAGVGRESQIGMLDEMDAVVFTGGADVEPYRYGFEDPQGVCKTKPERDAAEWQILERLQIRPKPLLAICRGAQILNVFHGGTLVADLGDRNAVHRRAGPQRREHGVRITESTLLRRVTGLPAGRVNSSHHQAVDRLAGGMRVAAVSDDGVIEAFEHENPEGRPFLLAVQWHPEGMTPGLPLADRPLDAFLTQNR